MRKKLKGDVEKFGERIQVDGRFYFFGKQVFVGMEQCESEKKMPCG
jgi:hypothetical protein